MGPNQGAKLREFLDGVGDLGARICVDAANSLARSGHDSVATVGVILVAHSGLPWAGVLFCRWARGHRDLVGSSSFAVDPPISIGGAQLAAPGAARALGFGIFEGQFGVGNAALLVPLMR
jgi:hypothetical protein